jgi:hypothetical protein
MAIDVNLNGTLFPTDSLEPTHRDIYGFGGYRVVANSTERDAIPPNLLKQGTLVMLQSDGKVYEYDGVSSWDEYFGEIADDSITTDMIQDLAVVDVKLGNGSVIAGKLGPNAVELGNVANNSIGYGALIADSVEYATLRFDVINAFMKNWVASPATNSDAGVAGTMAYDDPYLYVCLVGAELSATSGVWGRVTMDTAWV